MNILAIDIGGTFIKYACITNRTLQKVECVPSPADTYQQLLSVLGKIVETTGPEMDGIAVSLPGVIDTNREKIISGGALAYLKGAPLKSDLEKKYGLPVLIENDAKAAVYAESDSGALRHVKNGIILVLGTGVGMGMKINGVPFTGSHFQSGEVSYFITDDSDHTEQALVSYQLSAVRLIHRLSEELHLPEDDGKEVFLKLRENKQAYKTFSDYTHKMAILIFNLFTILDFEKVVIGGGISRQSILIEQLQEKLAEVISLLHPQEPHPFIPHVSAAGYGPEANLMGVMLLLENDLKGGSSNGSSISMGRGY